MAYAELWIKEDTAPGFTANKRAQMVAWITDRKQIKYSDASKVEHNLLSFDGSMDMENDNSNYTFIKSLLFQNSGYLRSASATGTALLLHDSYLSFNQTAGTNADLDQLRMNLAVNSGQTVAKRTGISFLNKTSTGAVTETYAFKFDASSEFLSSDAPEGAAVYIKVNKGGSLYKIALTKDSS